MVFEFLIIWMQDFLIDFGYIAVFFGSLISTSTIFIPLPIYFIIFFAAGIGLNPLVVGILAGAGSAVGELTGYFVGLGSRAVIERREEKEPRWIKFFTKLFKKYGFATILVTSLLPFPFDVIGILSGVSDYNIKKFFIATLIGKTIKTVLIAYAGFVAIPYAEILLQDQFG